MTKGAFQLIAVATLPLAVAGGYVLGRPVAAGLGWLWSDTTSLHALLRLLGYLLGELVAVAVWAALLAPIRARAGFTPIRQELTQLESEGLGNAIQREQRALERRRASADPRERAAYHRLFAVVSALVGLVGVAMSLVLYEDGYIVAFPLTAALCAPLLTIYHAVQWGSARLAVSR